jgi:hypothetical protein
METQAVSWMPSKGATPHEYLAGLYPPQAWCVQDVGCWLQVSADPCNVSSGITDVSIMDVAIVFW